MSMKTEEKENLKMLAEYLFFDQYSGSATFQRFEQCFQPLLKSKQNISMDKVFKEICGEKKKYMTGRRFVSSYLNYKKNPKKVSQGLKTFFDLLFNKIIIKDPFQIGKPKENCYNFSTVKSSNKRECISQIQILTGKNNAIHGLNITYDDVYENHMYPTELEHNLSVSLEMNLGLVDEKPVKQKLIGKLKEIKEKFYRDAVTHVFGTMNSKNIITFLGFKCISGKTEYVGVPEGNGFLMGEFGKKFHSIKLQMTENGIHLLTAVFNENPRTNFYIRKNFDNPNLKDLDKEEFVLDEKHLDKINKEEDIDKFITTPLIEDNHFFNNKLKDEISGNDYKEVVDQHPREWIIKKDKEQKLKNVKKINNINDALKIYDEENKKKVENEEPTLPNLKYIKGKKGESKKKDKNKSKSKNKNKNGKKKLHKKKKFIKIRDKDEKNDIINNIPRWNGNKDMKNVSPNIFYKSKYNYKNLKNELARIIQKEIEENNVEEFTDNKESLLEHIFPEMAEYQGKVDFNKNTQKPNLKKKKLKKKIIRANSIDDKTDYKKRFSRDRDTDIGKIYSDAMQFVSDFTNNNSGRGKFFRRTSSGNTIIDDENLLHLSQQYIPTSDDTETLRTNIKSNSAASNRKKNNNAYITRSNSNNIKEVQENYHRFYKQLKKVNGVYLLQTMGAIIKAMHVIDDDNRGKKRISLSEKIELLKLLEENEIIIDFLTQKDLKCSGCSSEIKLSSSSSSSPPSI